MEAAFSGFPVVLGLLLLLLWWLVRLDRLRAQGCRRPLAEKVAVGVLWFGFCVVLFCSLLIGLATWQGEEGFPPARAGVVLGLLASMPLWFWKARWILQKLGLDPQRILHRSMPYVIFLLLLSTLLLPPAGPKLAAASLADGGALASLAVQLVWNGLLAFLAVGWLSHRTPLEAARRLQLRRVPLGSTLGRIFLTYAALEVMTRLIRALCFGIGQTTGLLFSWPEVEESLPLPPFSLGLFLSTLLVIVLIAPLGEELLFRGALQPRVGIFLASLLFALLHASRPLPILIAMVAHYALLGSLVLRYSLWLSFGVHALHNLQAVTAPYLQEGPFWLEAVVQIGTVALGIGAWLYLLFRWCQRPRGEGRFLPNLGLQARYGLWMLAAVALLGTIGFPLYLNLTEAWEWEAAAE